MQPLADGDPLAGTPPCGLSVALQAVGQRQEQKGLTVKTLGAGLIGLAQTLALIPGTSRSGITITAAFQRM